MMKKLLALAVVGIMTVAMSVPTFAATGHDARLYKNGKYNASAIDKNLSMGDGALKDATVTVSDGQVTVIVEIDEGFTYLGMSGKLTKAVATDDGFTATLIDTNSNSINDQLVVTCPSESFSYGEVINLDFTVTAWKMPVSSSGDLVIFQ